MKKDQCLRASFLHVISAPVILANHLILPTYGQIKTLNEIRYDAMGGSTRRKFSFVHFDLFQKSENGPLCFAAESQMSNAKW
jgi:hypothetical protein